MYKNKRNVGAHDCFQKGITLIALVITIIVMLILVAVTISMAVNGGLFEYAGKAVGDTQNEIDAEQQLASGKIKVGNTWYDSIDDYLNNTPSGTQGGGNTEGDGEGTGVNEDDPYAGQIADFTEEIGLVNSADVIAYFYQKDNGNYDLVVRGTGEVQYESSDCSGLFQSYDIENAYILEGVTGIGVILCDNRTLRNVVLPDSLERIEAFAFYRCSKLEEITFHSGLDSIANFAFYGCSSLTEITIPDSVTNIGEWAFWGCSELESITIGIGLTSVGENAFVACVGLKTVYYAGTKQQWNNIEISNYYRCRTEWGQGNDRLIDADIICLGE